MRPGLAAALSLSIATFVSPLHATIAQKRLIHTGVKVTEVADGPAPWCPERERPEAAPPPAVPFCSPQVERAARAAKPIADMLLAGSRK